MRKTAALIGIVLGGIILIVAFAIRFQWMRNPFVNGSSNQQEEVSDNGRQSAGNRDFSRQSNPNYKGRGRNQGRTGRRPSRQRGRGWQKFINFFKGGSGDSSRQSGTEEMPSRQGTVNEE